MPTAARRVRPVKVQMRDGIEKYGWCRANQHLWSPPSVSGQGVLGVSKGIVQVDFTCQTCGGTRSDEYTLRTGELVSRNYKMPDGYALRLKDTGEARPRKATWRAEHFRHLLKGENR